MADQGFLGEIEESGFLTEDPYVTPINKGFLSSTEEEQDRIVESGLTAEEFASLKESNTIAQEDITETELAPPGVEGVFKSLLEEQADEETIRAQVAKQTAIEQSLREMETFTSVDKALAYDKRVGELLWKTEHRKGVVSSQLFDMAEDYADGFGGTVLEFIDQMVYDTIIGVRDVGQQLSGSGSEVSTLSEQWQLALRTYDDEQFENFVQERMSALSTAGLSGKEASWRVIREIEAIETAGSLIWDEENSVLAGALTAFDIATLGTTGALRTVKAGRSTIGRLRSSAGTAATTEAATGTNLVVRGGIDGEVLEAVETVEDLSAAVEGASGTTRRRRRPTVKENVMDAEIIEDIAPNAVRSSATPQQRAAPPVSSGTVAQTWTTNRFIQQFLNRQASMSFGTFDLSKAASDWAKLSARRMALSSGSSMMDWDIIEEGIQQAKAKFTFGKNTGEPFKTYHTAVEVAKDLPNSYIIDTRTGKKVTGEVGSSEYAIVSEMRVPHKDLQEPLDLSEVTSRTALGRIFGRADYGSSSFMSNLADFAEAGSLGYLQDFKKTLKSINSLKKEERKAVDGILTSLRDTPTKGTPRSWLSSAEFVEAYRKMTGGYPSKKVIQAYEDTVQLSDFNWWVKANDRLRVLADQEASVINVNGNSTLVFPTDRVVSSLREEGRTVWAWDVATQKRVNIKSISDDEPLMAFASPAADGTEFVVHYQGKSRVPELNDAFPYSAGGPRSNPEITWFVGNRDSGWSTLLGAKSEGEARKAADQFNTVAHEIGRIVGNSPENVSMLSPQQRRYLNDLVRKNNEWNPNLETVDEFIEFATIRGVPYHKEVVFRGRGEKLASVIKVNDKSLIDLDLQSYVSYHRHDEALLEYGGAKASNPDPLFAIQHQFTQMATRGANTQYRMAHPTAWVKAVEKAAEEGHIVDLGVIHPMTDEMKVRNLQIGGNSEVARKLRQEQSVINRRLDLIDGSVSMLPTGRIYEGATRSAEVTAEIVYDWNNKAGSVAKWFSGLLKSGSNKLLTLGFFQAMASIDQVLLQSAHAIPVMAISPKNGLRSLTIATSIRQAARTGDEGIWAGLRQGMLHATGVSSEELDILMEHMLDSGRGYMKGAVAEDPAAGMTNSMLGKVKDIASAPYYAGENYSATLSRVTAFFDTRDNFPSLDPKSRGFWNEVQRRDRAISFSLNRAQKSMAQTDPVLRVATQWTSYPLRTIESIFFGDLTGVERGRLAAATTILWGLSGLGLSKLAQDADENIPGALGDVIAYGADVAFDELLGVQVGSRIALNPVELFERAALTFTKPGETIPAFTILGDTAEPVLDAFTHAGSGRWGLLSHDAATLARAWKIVDAPVMAWTMMQEDARISASGSVTRAEFTPVQEVLQAIGITPSEVTEMSRVSNILYNARQRRDMAVDKATPILEMAVRAAEDKRYGKALQLIKDFDAVLGAYGLPDTRLAEARQAAYDNLSFDRVNWMVLELVKEGYDKEALEFNETFK